MSVAPTITAGTTMRFGKYKGRSIVEVLAIDAGYVFWLAESGTATLDDEVAECVDAWVAENKEQARKTAWSARKTRDERERGKVGAPTKPKPEPKVMTPDEAKDAASELYALIGSDSVRSDDPGVIAARNLMKLFGATEKTADSHAATTSVTRESTAASNESWGSW